MKKLTGLLLGSLFVLAGMSMEAQQAPPGPPKVLSIIREYVKPGRTGSMHDKSEAAFVKAMADAKWPQHYVAVDSMSGPPRSLFLLGYDSFEAWEKDNRATEKNVALTAAMERAALADSELLASTDSAAFAYREDYSLRPEADIPHMRYFEISLFHIRQGRRKEWEEMVKMYKEAYEKIPDTRWVVYEGIYGNPDGTYLLFNPLKSLAETDRALAQGKQFETVMGAEGMQKLRELAAASIESSQTNLFSFNPRESYPPEDWIKADPDFWKPKPAAAR